MTSTDGLLKKRDRLHMDTPPRADNLPAGHPHAGLALVEYLGPEWPEVNVGDLVWHGGDRYPEHKARRFWKPEDAKALEGVTLGQAGAFKHMRPELAEKQPDYGKPAFRVTLPKPAQVAPVAPPVTSHTHPDPATYALPVIEDDEEEGDAGEADPAGEPKTETEQAKPAGKPGRGRRS